MSGLLIESTPTRYNFLSYQHTRSSYDVSFFLETVITQICNHIEARKHKLSSNKFVKRYLALEAKLSVTFNRVCVCEVYALSLSWRVMKDAGTEHLVLEFSAICLPAA